MPCFKGIAVSIHANGAPLPEHGIQKQSRVSRINSYIPVPQPQITPDTGKPEAAKFAISITLLTPSLPIPYSTPKPTEANPHPRAQLVGEMPAANEDGRAATIVTPYIPMTNSENETIAAYIYFDGRAKEEVATLLRPGEETWVNSRWVQVPESEGGGLAEREFLFREVGLERWLNGLDLEGHDAAKKLEKRRQRFERRRKRQESQQNQQAGGGSSSMHRRRSSARSTHFKYGADDEPSMTMSDDWSDDSLSSDDELPEAAGQIKVAMFRVLASGEIKKGEYSPQFDAHDDDDDTDGAGNSGGGTVESDVEHTTSFAKPKTLDPKTISTQTVTGIDGPDRPYATFTFFYRGERQLQKMGIIPSAKSQQPAATATKRRSAQLDFSNIGTLKTGGTVGFSTFRDQSAETARRKSTHKKHKPSISNAGAMDEDSDDDDDDDKLDRLADADDKDDRDVKSSAHLLAPEDAQFSGELADGVNRIRLKRQHSVEPDSDFRKSPSSGNLTPVANGSGAAGAGSGSGATSGLGAALAAAAAASGGGQAGAAGGMAGSLTPSGGATSSLFSKSLPDDSVIGSPLKKHRASVAEGLASFPPALGDILAKAEAAQKQQQQQQAQALIQSLQSARPSSLTAAAKDDEDEEL